MDRMRYESDGRIARVVIDDGKANAMSVPFLEELTHLLDRAEGDGSSALVIAGRAGMFSGGLDLKLLPMLSREGLRELSETFARTMLRVFTFPLPTVAAITGHAIAGGAVLA
ncbi:MAG: enoyl-CoA hydratase/isomerase family protein [Deltaproteobacteria bacterium]|nr:enoyl-CoA hydratase/isomerase family protein [Deltaproteobacteria bacterium]